MALKLNVPALEEKPLVLAQTQTSKVTEFVTSLPVAQPLVAATTLLDELEILNRQKVSTDIRYKILEIYRPSAINICESLAAEYSSAAIPLSEEGRKSAELAQKIWLEFSYGYKLALLDEKSQLFSLSGKKYTAQCIFSAIDALNKLMMVYYHSYFNVPSNVWSDLHQLYLYAAEQNIHQLELDSNNAFVKASTIDLAYKQVLLMSLADPRHLNNHDINLVSDYIARHAHLSQIQGLANFDNPSGIFLVSLNKDKPPIPYIKNASPTDAQSDILFITIDLARTIHQHILMLQTKVPTNKDELPENAADPRYLDLLVYLIKHWAASPKRIFGRKNKNNFSELAAGINAAHYYINGEQAYQQPANAGLVTDISQMAHASQENMVSKKTPSLSRWQLINISAGGLALRLLPNSQTTVRIGDLACIRNTNEPKWAIGIIRWANNSDQQVLDVGAELVAPEAFPVGIKSPNRSQFEQALILPAINALKQSSSLVASYGTYSPARVLELDENGTISRVLVTKLIERTANFERFQFSRMEDSI